MSRPSHLQPEHKQRLLLHDHCATAVDDLTDDPLDRVSWTSSCDDFEYGCAGAPKASAGGSSQYANVRPGFHLSQGVAHLLQLWPRSLVSLLWTVGLVVATCFVIVLTILLLVLSTNFSLDSDFVLTHRTRSRSIRPADLVNDDVINWNNGDVIDAENGFIHDEHGVIHPGGSGFTNEENDVRISNNGAGSDVINNNELARGLTTSLNEELLAAPSTGAEKNLSNDQRRTFRYILNASDDRINLFYVIDASETHRLSAHALNVLRYYVRAGYKVYVVRVCRNPVAGADSERQEMSGRQQRQEGKLRSERVATDDDDTGKQKHGNVGQQHPVEENSFVVDRQSADSMQNSRHPNDPLVKLILGSDPSSNRVVLNNGIVDPVTEEVMDSTTVDVETYDLSVKKELSLAALAGESPQSREFFARLRNLIGRNRTFAEESRFLRSTTSRRPLTSEEIEVGQSEDELKKVALCSCSQCRAYSEGTTRSKNRAVAALKDKLGMTSPRGPVQGRGGKAAAFHDDWSKVEILNVNYDELLTDSGIFADLGRSSGVGPPSLSRREQQSADLAQRPLQETRRELHSKTADGDMKLRGAANDNQRSLSVQPAQGNSKINRQTNPDIQLLEEDLGVKNQSSQNGNPHTHLIDQDGLKAGGDPDMNLVKLVLLWKFGNSMVLLRDQSLLHHSRMIVKSRVNLGFQMIYTPYECSSVIYNLMEVYKKEQGNMNKAIVDVYRLFCKSLGRFCTAITYVQLRRGPTRK
uniref:Uncharacterized protein n=1 Tax=Cacopsylla melanoneura TaxID=428564 RepID=A0A8D8R1X9_9HEMI